MLSSVCSNYQGFYAQRFFLGFLESGISPMFMLIVVSIQLPQCWVPQLILTVLQGGWYKKNEQALRMGYVITTDTTSSKA